MLNFKVEKIIGEEPVILFPTVIQSSGKNYLIDCGYEETFDEFIVQLNHLGIKISDLHSILISHDDIDHIGALKLFKDANPKIVVCSSKIEEASVSGRIKSERLNQVEESLPYIAEEYKPAILQFLDKLQQIKRIDVDLTLEENDLINNEILVVQTPGHTKGHISFYIPSEKTLIANDALIIEEGGFNIANPQFTLDIEAAVESVKKIKDLEAEKIICYHGGIMDGDVQAKLNDLLSKYE